MAFKHEKFAGMYAIHSMNSLQQFLLAAHQARAYKRGSSEMNSVKPKFLSPQK